MNELKEKLEIEELQATYFDKDALLLQPESIYRLQGEGNRYYYTFNSEGEPTFYISVTTMIKQTLPTSQHLIKWIAEKGYDESKEYTDERANYGTFLHIEIAKLLINESYDLDKLKNELKAYLAEQKLPDSFIEWHEELKKDLLAFAQFMIDHDVKPLAIEIILTNPNDGYAGAIDLVCELTIEEKGFWGETYKSGANKGEPKETKKEVRKRAIIDFKSGRKGFYESSEIQLHAYKRMWDLHFDQYPVDILLNWSPKNWITAPSYNLKDQTGSKNAEKLDYLVQLAAIEDEKRKNNVTITGGKINLKKGLNENIQIMNMSEIVKKAKDEEPKKFECPEGIEKYKHPVCLHCNISECPIWAEDAIKHQ